MTPLEVANKVATQAHPGRKYRHKRFKLTTWIWIIHNAASQRWLCDTTHKNSLDTLVKTQKIQAGEAHKMMSLEAVVKVASHKEDSVQVGNETRNKRFRL